MPTITIAHIPHMRVASVVVHDVVRGAAISPAGELRPPLPSSMPADIASRYTQAIATVPTIPRITQGRSVTRVGSPEVGEQPFPAGGKLHIERLQRQVDEVVVTDQPD